MSYLLHIETATEVCSVALSQGEVLLALCEADAPMVHTAQTTLLIEECLAKAAILPSQLSAISISQGPGSYTALRVGASIAKGMCYALQIPLIAIDTLQSLAMAAAAASGDETALYCAMIDARRMEAYTAIYNSKGEVISPMEALIIDAHVFDHYFTQGQKIIFTGNAAFKCEGLIASPLAQILPLQCTAKFLIKIANQKYSNKDFADIAYFSPEYAKNPNITLAKKVF